MFAVASFRGAVYGQLLYAGDDVSAQEWDHREALKCQAQAAAQERGEPIGLSIKGQRHSLDLFVVLERLCGVELPRGALVPGHLERVARRQRLLLQPSKFQLRLLLQSLKLLPRLLLLQ